MAGRAAETERNIAEFIFHPFGLQTKTEAPKKVRSGDKLFSLFVAPECRGHMIKVDSYASIVIAIVVAMAVENSVDR